MPRVFLFVFFNLMTLASTLSAQEVVPEYRYVVEPDMDFYGSDLDAQFDTSLQACERACSSLNNCVAFTFNSRSNACFPKGDVQDRTPYQGAISARKTPSEAGLAERARTAATQATFLGQSDLNAAREQAEKLGFRHRAGGQSLEDVLASAAARRAAGDTLNAMRWTGAAVSLSDRGDLWTDYARLLSEVAQQTRDGRRERRQQAVSAGVNGYLRAQGGPAQATALAELARAFEAVSRGRDMVAALRLANELHPREDLSAALDKAIAKYGFRIVDSWVESDSARPRICASFSEDLRKSGVDYDSYVQLPDPTFAVSAQDRDLCIEGVQHGGRYQLTFRQGLPAQNGETLSRSVTLTHYVRDRAPSVRFPGRAYVLPRTADAALPVETVNADTLELTLRRVSDRNLLRAIQDGYFGQPLSYYQDRNFGREIAQQVWTGEARVASELNRDMTARLSLAEAIKDQPAGIYALTARVPGVDVYDDAGGTQWFVLSDLGISSLSGNDGMHVTVRSLTDTNPLPGAVVQLVSGANAVLGKAITDKDGYAHFEAGLTRGRGSAAPAMIYVTDAPEGAAQDASFLSLMDPAFDLSDRGVEGRAAAGPVDVFLTTDRGAYRAGETIHATALARDGTVRALTGLPLTAILTRPDGVEYSRALSGGDRAGGHVFSMPLGEAVPRGTWRLEIKADPDAPALASQRLLVEDFLPERIDFDQNLIGASLRAGASADLQVQARYLFGAPGANLALEGNVRLSPARELAQFPGFRFGRHDLGLNPRASSFGGQRTDARGAAVQRLDLPLIEAPGLPLRAQITTRISDGAARPVERVLEADVSPQTDLIGIKPMFEDVAPEGGQAGFQILGLGADLLPAGMEVRWTLNRVETRYQWYQEYGNWNWEPITRRERIATGTATLDEVPVPLSVDVDWGQYELEVERIDGGYVAASVDFSAGWYAADASQTPDRLEMSLDQANYAPGDTARLRVIAPQAGTVMVSVLSDGLIARKVVAAEAGENLIPLEVSKAWGVGAYVSATLLRPLDAAAKRNPARALGIAYASVAPQDKALSVQIDAPSQTAPRQTQKVAVTVTGQEAGQEVWVTLAAIDQGILNLTGFQSPDPQGYYFGQRRLGVEMRDLYGRLIDGMNGAMGQVRSGGDGNSGLGRKSPPPTQELMAVFSGPVELSAQGRAEIDVPLKAFNGTVRLMAVVWSDSAVGQADAEMIVRDPVVVTASLPRFLSPGDQSRMRLEIIHAEGPTGPMPLRFDAENAVKLGPEMPAQVSLSEGQTQVLNIPLTALRTGDPVITVSLTTPDGKELRQKLTLPIRQNDPEIARTRRFTLNAGDVFVPSPDMFAGLQPGTGSAILSAGPLARLDAPGLLRMLDRYPYGCTEQVTSQALPLLYLSSVAQSLGQTRSVSVEDKIAQAIDTILSRQAASGGFGLWRAQSGDFWLDAYVTDFLSRARASGHAVPEQAFRMALDNLRNQVNYAPDFDQGGADIAYALMVLAREGAAAMGDLRYYADEKAGALATPLAQAQLGAALAQYGDQTRADALFARAAQTLQGQDRPEAAFWRADYGTFLRDRAGVLALSQEARSAVLDVEAQLTRIVADMDQSPSTQEAAWSLLAAKALVDRPEASGLRVNGAVPEGPFVRVVEQGALPDLSLTSADGQQTEITLTTFGVPDVNSAAGGTGYAIQRGYYSMEGAPVDPSLLRVGERLVTVLTVSAFDRNEARLMVNDPLPAGFEIDNPSLLRSGDVSALDWLSLSAAEHSEFRSDRFLSAVDLRDGRAEVTLAYVVRAVSPGRFHHPAAQVEDMYRPRYRAWTSSGAVEIRE